MLNSKSYFTETTTPENEVKFTGRLYHPHTTHQTKSGLKQTAAVANNQGNQGLFLSRSFLLVVMIDFNGLMIYL